MFLKTLSWKSRLNYGKRLSSCAVVLTLFLLGGGGTFAQDEPVPVKKGFSAKSHFIIGFAARPSDMPYGVFVCLIRPPKSSQEIQSINEKYPDADAIGSFFLKSSIGYYIDFIGNSGPDADYDFSRLYAEDILGDKYLGEDHSWISIRAGITKTISAHCACYVALGVSIHNGYRQYYDKYHILGKSGRYWIPDGKGTEEFFDAGLGVFILIGRSITLRTGMGLQPFGIDVGVGLTMPDM
jgi:hypothetical protein